MKKLNFIIEVVWAFFIMVSMIYDAFMGIKNHDAYYMIWVVLELILLHLSVKDIEKDIDNM